MAVEQLLLFIAAGLLLNLTPGPDVLYIVSHALRSGARAGMVAALGITAGCFVHILAAAMGVTALVAASATAFHMLQWLGAAYLVYVGMRLWLSREPAGMALTAPTDPVPWKARTVLARGFLTNVLNPKVALFFLAFVPQFIPAGSAHTGVAFLALGLLFNANGLLVNLGWALAAAWLAGRAETVRRAVHWLDRLAGALFVLFGIRLALSDAPAV